uniref:Uncharacterized protein n=1 Tax=Trichogramma kaykai TaxID=54128 RepID=A0ABD2XKR7_9HYME
MKFHNFFVRCAIIRHFIIKILRYWFEVPKTWSTRIHAAYKRDVIDRNFVVESTEASERLHNVARFLHGARVNYIQYYGRYGTPVLLLYVPIHGRYIVKRRIKLQQASPAPSKTSSFWRSGTRPGSSLDRLVVVVVVVVEIDIRRNKQACEQEMPSCPYMSKTTFCPGT